jgi:hypothetical protein
MVLLGLTGCAGVQQRLGWTEPPYQDDQDSGERPLSRLAFWRRPRAESDGSAMPSSANSQQGRTTALADNGGSNDDDDADERPGLLRRLPVLSRLWKQSGRDDDDSVDRPAASRYMATPFAAANTAFVPPARPAATTAFVPPTRPANAASSPAPAADETAAAAAGSAPAPDGSTAAVPAERSSEEPTGELALDVSEPKPEIDPAAVPAGHADAPATASPSPSPGAAEPAPSISPGLLAFNPQQPNTTTPAPADSVPPPPVAGPGKPLGLDADQPPLSNTGPALPSTTLGGGQTPSGSVISSVVELPTWSASQSTLMGSGQTMVTTSAQAGVISSGCDQPCGKKCNLIHKLCPFKKHQQVSSVVYPSGQGLLSSCEGTCKVKKPCFLKTWLHHKSGCKLKGCKGCRSCAYCGEAPAIVSSSQEIVTSSQH